MEINLEQFKNIMLAMAQSIKDNVSYLTELDARIGDGDHGVNMEKGFKRIAWKVEQTEAQDIGQILIESGKVLLNEIGGAMGPLYGGGFVKAGTALKGKKILDKKDIATLFSLFLDSVKFLGQAKVGDKTMVDTLEPFVSKYREQIKDNDIVTSFKAGLAKAKEGMQSTRNMVSKVGRSSRLLERSRGHIDVGAVSSYLILEAFYRRIKDLKGQDKSN